MDSSTTIPITPTRTPCFFNISSSFNEHSPLNFYDEPIYNFSSGHEENQSHKSSKLTFFKPSNTKRSPHTPMQNNAKAIRLSTTVRHGIFKNSDLDGCSKPFAFSSGLKLSKKIVDASTPIDLKRKRAVTSLSTGLLSKREKWSLWEGNLTNPRSEQPHTPCKKGTKIKLKPPQSPLSPTTSLLARKCKHIDLDTFSRLDHPNSDSSDETFEMEELPSLSYGSEDLLEFCETPCKSQPIFLSSSHVNNWDEKDVPSSLSWTPTSPNFLNINSADDYEEEEDWTSDLRIRFQQVKPIHESDFSFVYHVSSINPPTETVYVVKMLKKNAAKFTGKERHLQEVSILQRLQACPFVVNLVNVWSYNDNIFLQLDYCENGDLSSFLSELGLLQVMDPFRVWKMLFQLTQVSYYIFKSRVRQTRHLNLLTEHRH